MDEFDGRPFYGGIDIALMWDMSAFAMLFPWGKTDDKRRFMKYRLVCEYFIPEEGFLQLSEKVPAVLDWRERGFLNVTPGTSFDEPTYIECVLEARKRFDCRGLAFDPRYAHSLAQTLQDAHSMELKSFNQSGITFGGPVSAFEKACADGVMEHNGHPLLNWNVQNAVCIERPGNIKLLAKPIRGNHKKIDGLVAAVMALGMCLSKPEVTSIYEEEGALFG